MRSLWGYLHTRDAGRIGTSVDLWRICIQQMRPTVDESLSSGHCESVVTRLVLITCVSDHALAMAQDSSLFCFWRFVTFVCCALVPSACHPRPPDAHCDRKKGERTEKNKKRKEKKKKRKKQKKNIKNNKGKKGEKRGKREHKTENRHRKPKTENRKRKHEKRKEQKKEKKKR